MEKAEDLKKGRRKIAYFSMEIGIDTNFHTYSGGLGILAADTIKSAADLKVPMVAVTLLYKKGYFRQRINKDGNQEELPDDWQPQEFLQVLPNRIKVEIENNDVFIRAWEYRVEGISKYYIPIIFLDTDIEENNTYYRSLSYYLYGGDQKYRLSQEIVLGIGGVRMLKELGYTQINRYHMNEGHSSLLTLELLRERKKVKFQWDVEGVKRLCVFTTHTPVPAGMDKFSYDLVMGVLGEFIPLDFLKEVGGKDRLNMTLLALNLSHYENGVAKEHSKISRELFPGYHIDSITNGVHSGRWVCQSFAKLYDKYIPGWRNEPFSLRYALHIPKNEIWNAHQQAKAFLIDYVNKETNIGMDKQVLTIGFARRATAYKRADLIFYDYNRLIEISNNIGKLQFIFAGKAHPQDGKGKELIRRIVNLSHQLDNQLKIVYLQDYDIELAKMLVSGVDLWLNTPRKPLEASGTSGMKAAHNGIPSLSILDGWWIEGCIEGLTGWAIGEVGVEKSNDADDAQSLYDKLKYIIIPMFYNQQDNWVRIMQHAIAINGSFFNTHRMLLQYVLNAYLD